MSRMFHASITIALLVLIVPLQPVQGEATRSQTTPANVGDKPASSARLWKEQTRESDAATDRPERASVAPLPDWDQLSGKVLPEVLARSGVATVASEYAAAGCLIDVEISSSFSAGCKGVLRLTTNDADNNGIISKDEVQAQVESVQPAESAPQMQQARAMFEAQEFGNLRNLLLIEKARTVSTGDGFLVTLNPSGPGSPLASLGCTELSLTVSEDFSIHAMRVATTQGAESRTRYTLKQLAGKWYPQGYTRRTSLPDGNTLVETGTSEYDLSGEVPLTSKADIRSEVLTGSGQTVATMRQNFTLRDWKVVKRTRSLAQAASMPADTRRIAGSQPLNTPDRTRRDATTRRAQAEQPPPDQHTGRQTSTPPELNMSGLEKYVSPKAMFAICKPIGWKVSEAAQNGFLSIMVQDPTGRYQVGMVCGANQFGDNRGALVKAMFDQLRSQYDDFEIGNVRESGDARKLVFDAGYKDAAIGRREGRCWLSFDAGTFVFSYCATPAGQFGASRATLLSILGNIRIMKNTIAGLPTQIPLVERRLGDGSATFLTPPDWRIQDSGTCHFVATDPAGRCSFIVAKVDMLTPELGVNFPGAIILPYTSPHRAMRTLAVQGGILSNFEFEQVTPREDVARMIGQVFTAGPVSAEEFTYTAVGRAGRSKAYTFGISWGSRLNTNWAFSHLTVSAPADEFDSWAPTLARMVQSYKINDDFAARYIAEGTARLRRMQQETARIIAKNAEDIRNMMQAAYDERGRSQDYIDYQRTTYIRGETDWISGMEGGTVYHSDSWGTKNTWTGESWEGSPYHHVNFEGRNPKYNEQMTKIDSRELYEQAFGRRPAR